MREIKFRAKRKDNEEFIFSKNVIYIDNRCFLLIEPDIEFMYKANSCDKDLHYTFITSYNENDVKIENGVEYYPLQYEVDCNTISQYTGLKDKNNKEIYEGDIVRYSWLPKDHPQHKTDVVVIEDIRYIPPVLTKGWTFEIEVICNIYENPELLK